MLYIAEHIGYPAEAIDIAVILAFCPHVPSQDLESCFIRQKRMEFYECHGHLTQSRIGGFKVDFGSYFHLAPAFLMEGALGERLKREFHLRINGPVGMADLIYLDSGRQALQILWRQYRSITEKYCLPFLATTPTRRCNRERVKQGQYPDSILAEQMSLLQELKQNSSVAVFTGGLMGCKGDAYTGEGYLKTEEAHRFHSWQANQLAKAKADFLYAGIMPTIKEAKGIAMAMAETGLPYLISFTIKRNGRLVDGTFLHDAIASIDSALTSPPLCYMANCVHPDIVWEALMQPYNQTPLVHSRFLGIQANTSSLSFAELDGSDKLQCSDPEEWADAMTALKSKTKIRIWGGCCGTDGRHMEALARRLAVCGSRLE